MKRENWYISTIDPKADALARQFGLGLEIAEYCTAYNMDQQFEATHAQVSNKLEGIAKRTFHAPFNELFPCAIDPKARDLAADRYRQALSLAHGYGASKVVIHGGYNPWLYYPVWYTEQSVVFWREFAEQIPEGMEVCLENVLEEEPGMLLDILKAVGSPRLGLCLDIGHVNAYSKVGVEDWMYACAPYISHFHIHNNDSSWDTHSPLDCGTIPVERILELAEKLCPKATYTLELPEAEPSVRWLLERGIIL